jgi:hypothetical protein
MTPQETEKIKLMQLFKQGKIDTLPDVDSDAYKASKVKDMMSKTEGVDEVTSRVGSRIEGLLNIEMKNKFLNAGMDLIQDLLEDDPFDIEDVIDHLAIELSKYYDERSSFGAKINDLEEETPGPKNPDGTPKSNDEMTDDEREDYYNNLDDVNEETVDEGVKWMKRFSGVK